MKVINRAQLLAEVGDPLVAYQAGPDDICLLADNYWATISAEDGVLSGALAVLKGSVDGAELIGELESVSQENGLELSWLSVDGKLDIAARPEWKYRSDWVWMWAQRVVGGEGYDLVNLDDLSDAEEINNFAIPLNPLFEGSPGHGMNLFWVGARGDDGGLIGCGTVRETQAGFGHIAGIIVDPEHRGRGLGSAIVAELSRKMLERDPAVTISAYAENENAICVYEKLGFKLAHRFSAWATKPRPAEPK